MSRYLKTVSFVLVLAFAFAALAPVALAAPPGPTIVDVAVAVNEATKTPEDPDGEFATLIAAVLAADEAVVETLSGNGQFTVFAPTDDAFEAAFAELGVAPGDVLSNKELLTDILLYHVARGRRYSGDVLDSDRIRVLKGGFLFQDGGVLTDNLGRDANIIVTDVEAANGIIHAIDAVVLPYAP
jgi:uncharacterized surface protein with fasciclin (FAS1) repeats